MDKQIDSKLLSMMLEKLIGDADSKDGAAIISVDGPHEMECDDKEDHGDHEYRDGGTVQMQSDGWKDGGMIGCDDSDSPDNEKELPDWVKKFAK